MPVNAPNRIAPSATVRIIGPAVSWLCAIGMMPLRLTNPNVGLMPTSEFADEGQTIEPSVSVPIEPAHKFAAVAAPEPELEPQGFAIEHIGILCLPATTTPATRRMGRSEVGPFAEICFPQDYCPRAAQSFHNKGILRGMRVKQGQRACGRHHPIGGVDIVFN